MVGASDGESVGDKLGDCDGVIDGAVEGDVDGALYGLFVGVKDGLLDGAVDGLCVGDSDGERDGDDVGLSVGAVDGDNDGEYVGDVLGDIVGLLVGESDEQYILISYCPYVDDGPSITKNISVPIVKSYNVNIPSVSVSFPITVIVLFVGYAINEIIVKSDCDTSIIISPLNECICTSNVIGILLYGPLI